jgi:hypothetical protein
MLRLIFTSYFGAVGVMSFFIVKSALVGVLVITLCLLAMYAINYKQ